MAPSTGPLDASARASNLTPDRRRPMDFDAIRAREAAHFLPVVKRFPVALASGRGSRVRDVIGPGVRRPDGGLGRHLHRPLAPRARARDRRAGRPPDADDEHLLHAAAARPLRSARGARARRRSRAAFLTNSGTEAVEGALKLAHRATGAEGVRVDARRVPRPHARRAPGDRHGQAPRPVSRRCCPSRCSCRSTTSPRRGARSTRACAAFIVEPVQGEGGVNVPSPGYLRGLRELCDASGRAA